MNSSKKRSSDRAAASERRAKFVSVFFVLLFLPLAAGADLKQGLCTEDSACGSDGICLKPIKKAAGFFTSFLGGTGAAIAESGTCAPKPAGPPCTSDSNCGEGQKCFQPYAGSAFTNATIGAASVIGYCIAGGTPAALATAEAGEPVAPEIPLIKPRLEIPIPTVKFTSPLLEDGIISIPFLAQYAGGVYQFLVGVVGIVAAVMMMVGGFQYLTAGGDGQRVGKAKKRIADALIGMALAFGSYLMLWTLNPDLVEFKALQIAGIQTSLFGSEESKADPESEDAADAVNPQPVETGNCSTPGFEILDASKVDVELNKSTYNELKKKLTPAKVETYKKAAELAKIPWEVLAAVHLMEAGMRDNGSILNGGPLCNSNDNPDLLKECPACRTPSAENDLYCGARNIAKKTPGLTKDNIPLIKLAFCRYNGCNAKKKACPDIHAYVSPKFDQNHLDYYKTGVDCLPINCIPNCTADITKKGSGKSYGKGCCAIRVYKPGSEPAGWDPGGSKCVQNQKKACGRDNGDGTITYTYVPGDRSESIPCGTRIRQERAGALTVYALILKLEEAGNVTP